MSFDINALPEKIRDFIEVEDKGDRIELTHPYLEPQELFNETRRVIEGLGGKYLGYYAEAAHYEIPKSALEQEEIMPHGLPELPVETPQATIEPAFYADFPIDKIISPTEPLRVDITEDIEELMNQISAVGRVLENLVARPHPRQASQVELAVGERRLLAARRLGLKTVPIIVVDLTDEEFDKTRLIENIARKDLSDYELGKAFTNLQKKYNHTQEQIANLIGKSQPFVAQKIEHYQTIEQAKPTLLRRNNVENVAEAEKKIEQLSSTQTRVIRQAPREQHPELIKETITKDLKPKQIETQLPIRRVNCEKCHVGTLSPQEVEGHILCPYCFERLQKGEFTLEKPKVEKPKVEPKPEAPKVKDSWEHRQAQMKPAVSQMEQAILIALNEKGLYPESQRVLCVQTVIPDLYFPHENLAIFLDGEAVHKHPDKDEALRELMKKRLGINYLSIPYKANTKTEQDQILQQIMTSVSAMGGS